MTRIIFFALLVLSACGTRKSETANAPPNQLTEQEKTEGWKLLFDGQTMNGWRFFKNKENDTWEVQNGTLHSKPITETDGTHRADLITADQYANFELVLDWKVSPKGNSGIIYRVTEEFEVSYGSGPEYQIIDDINYPGKLKPENTTGGNYDMQVPQNKTLNPSGEWNSTKIVVNGNHVEHWLNGNKLLEYELGSEEWRKMVAASKWKDYPGYGLAKIGYIALQDHGHEAWFRNIKIKPL